jgi:glycosyltransferase involved in cell wall biosynthesis
MRLSIVVCAYNMARELPRTVHTLCSAYQRDISESDYEILIVDNGSDEPVDQAALKRIAGNLRVVRSEQSGYSPATALNAAVRASDGDQLGIFIDGARMLSPAMLSLAREITSIDRKRVIGTLGFHLGPDVQMKSVANGYNQAIEDELLSSIPWQTDGYSLFDVSVLAGSSGEGWFGCLAESNGVFLPRDLWENLGGFDERFHSPGGGLVNLDFWERAVRLSDNQPWTILGEGTFHQVHGGAATNGTEEARAAMFAEYTKLHGRPFSPPDYTSRLFGSLSRDLARKFSGFFSVQ